MLERQSAWVYGLFGGVGASFGYWLTGVERDQEKELNERKARLFDKRDRQRARESSSRMALEGGS